MTESRFPAIAIIGVTTAPVTRLRIRLKRSDNTDVRLCMKNS